MTITVSPDFSELYMEFDEEIPMDSVTGGTAYFLLGCGDNQVQTNMSVENLLLTLSGNTVTQPADELYVDRTTFKDGVYKFVFELYDDIGAGNTHNVEYCMFIGTTTNCKAAKLILCQEDEILEYLMKALQNINACDDCDCSMMCDIYDAVQNRIDLLNSKNTTDVYNDCGCN